MKTKFALKKWRLVALMSLGVVINYTGSYAQDADSGTYGGGLSIGAKVGANFNQFSQPGTSMGGSAGGFVRYSLLNFLDIQGEIIYSLQGGARREFNRNLYYNGYDGPITYVQYINRNIYLHNVEVPVSARLTLPALNSGSVVPKLILGGSYSYNIAAFETNDKILHFTNGTSGLVSNTTENVRGDYFPHNFSAHAGIAIDFGVANGNVFTVEFKYRQGFSNLNQVSTTITELTDILHSSSFSVNFSYQIF